MERLKSQLSQYQSMRPETELSLEDKFMTMDVTEEGLGLTNPIVASVLQRSTKPSIDDKQRSRVRQMEKERREAKEVGKIV